MSDKPSNPPAFPCETSGDPNGFQSGAALWTYPGMTLRDWFAGQAIGAVIRQCAGDGMLGYPQGITSIEQLFAFKAYQIADAMLAERERQS